MLDGLRGWAVLGVMLHHYWPAATFRQSVAGISMQAFFVMSGFLITGQLLRNRVGIERGTDRPWTVVGQFFWRRFLRLTPVFYAVLLVMWLIGVEEVRYSFWWHVLYASNIYVVQIQDWPLWVSHFWSLAVEQQFYLVWPLLILFVPRVALLPTLLLAFAAGPLYRYIGAANDVTWLTIYVMPFGYLDSLAIGGLLAFFGQNAPGHERAQTRLVTMCGWLGTIGVTTSVVQTLFAYPMPYLAIWNVVEQLLWALWMAWLVDRGWRNRGGVVMRTLLTSRAILAVGSVSYGMYILHPLMPGALNFVLRTLALGRLREGGALFFVGGVATIGLASLSWRWFEQPINRLARKGG